MANGILVVLENNDGKISRIGWETLTAAQKIGSDLGIDVSAAVLGKDAKAMADSAAGKQADTIYAASNAALENYTPDGYTAALEQVIAKAAPAYIFVGHSYQARDYVAKLALRINAKIISDCIGYKVDGGSLMLTRQVFAGKFNADYSFSGNGPYIATFQAGAFSADGLQPGSAKVEEVAVDLSGTEIRTNVLDIFQGVKQEVDLSKAEVIVSAGRGLKEKDNMALVEGLAKALGGDVSGSRPVCDDGWLKIDRQIGSSGQTVSPKLYLAVGISGAIQHVVGMKNSKYIVAINKDPHAPIFEIADVAVVADLFEVVPALTKAVQEAA